MTLETIKSEIEANVPGCVLEIIPNPSPSAQHSLLDRSRTCGRRCHISSRCRASPLRLLLQRHRHRLARQRNLRKSKSEKDCRRRRDKRLKRSGNPTPSAILKSSITSSRWRRSTVPSFSACAPKIAPRRSICPRSLPSGAARNFRSAKSSTSTASSSTAIPTCAAY